jgi:hypothetical protein
MNTNKSAIWISILILAALLLAGCGGAADQPNAAANQASDLEKLSSGALPGDAASALDAAIQAQYYSPESFTANALRMMGKMKAAGSGYVEMQSTDTGLPFPAVEGGAPTLLPVAPSQLLVRGLADGTDVSILNYEDFVIQVIADTALGSVIIPMGSNLVRQGGAWVVTSAP